MANATANNIQDTDGLKKYLRNWWKPGVIGFYFLVAFEVFYMVTPFALYVYSIYGPLLEKLYEYPATSWLASFYLPHLVETSSKFISFSTEVIPYVFASLGGILFSIGALHLYYTKLIKRAMVSKGLYAFVRHPQYLGLSFAGFSLILMWPRFISLVMFITMLLMYYLLSKSEEKICEKKFGEKYLEYQNKIPMFVPFGLFNWVSKLFPSSGFKKGLSVFALYVVSVVVFINLGIVLKEYSKTKVSYFTQGDVMVVSVKPMAGEKMKEITHVVMSHREIEKKMSLLRQEVNPTFLVYITPERWQHFELTSTFKIKGEEAKQEGEHSDREENKNIYKVLLLTVKSITSGHVPVKALLDVEVRPHPLLLAYYDAEEGEVISVKELESRNVGFKGAPMPII